MTSRRILRTAAFVLAAGFAVVACGGSDSADDGSSSSPAATETADAPAADGDAPEILRFTSPLVGGGELDAATLAGTPTAFWFWSPT
jgi:ABC-type glycerol-3-phosphate transport system substrate-binding protein